MRITTLLAASALSFAIAAPAMAQDAMNNSMNSSSDMKMSSSAKRTMNRCNGMTHEAMMKSSSCKRFMKMHPGMLKDSMNGDNDMSGGH